MALCFFLNFLLKVDLKKNLVRFRALKVSVSNGHQLILIEKKLEKTLGMDWNSAHIQWGWRGRDWWPLHQSDFLSSTACVFPRWSPIQVLTSSNRASLWRTAWMEKTLTTGCDGLKCSPWSPQFQGIYDHLTNLAFHRRCLGLWNLNSDGCNMWWNLLYASRILFLYFSHTSLLILQKMMILMMMTTAMMMMSSAISTVMTMTSAISTVMTITKFPKSTQCCFT